MSIEFLPDGYLVPRTRTPEAIKLGILDGDFTLTDNFFGTNQDFAYSGNWLNSSTNYVVKDTDSKDSIENTISQFSLFNPNHNSINENFATTLVTPSFAPSTETLTDSEPSLVSDPKNAKLTTKYVNCDLIGGRDYLQSLHDKYHENIHVIGCGSFYKDIIMSRVPLNDVEDFKGLKIYSTNSLAIEYFRHVGAIPINVPESEVFSALRKGVINAVDSSSLSNNWVSGLKKFNEFKKYQSFGPRPTLQFSISESLWTGLLDEEKTGLENWFNDMLVDLNDQT